jgi:hypothetical protein
VSVKLSDILSHLSDIWEAFHFVGSGKLLISSCYAVRIYDLHLSLPRLARNKLITNDEVLLGGD